MTLRSEICLWLTIVQVLTFRESSELPHVHQRSHNGASPRAENDIFEKSIDLVTNETIHILPTLMEEYPHTTVTSLDERESAIPQLTRSIDSPKTLLQTKASPGNMGHSQACSPSDIFADIFADPIATNAPPSNIKIQNEHPVPRKGVASHTPIHTNKFYVNFFLGDQTAPAYAHPYSLHWVGGKAPTGSYGLAISHVEDNQRVYGEQKTGGAVAWYLNPVGIQSLVLGAKGLSRDTILSLDNLTSFSAHVHLRKDSKTSPAVSFPVVQGMGFVTGLYSGTLPTIQTGVCFKTVTRATKDPKPDVAKFKFVLEDGRTWVIYAHKTKGYQLDLQVVNNRYAEAKNPFYGSIQVSKDPGNREAILDEASGIYATGVKLKGMVSGTKGTYSFEFDRTGHTQGQLLMFALPHHTSSFDDLTKKAMTTVRLRTTTKGMATGVLCNKWTMVENRLPVRMNFAPFDLDKGPVSMLSEEAKKVIRIVAQKEISQNMTEQAVLDSMYFSGKALGKFALILYVINNMLGDKELAQIGLERLKQVFSVFTENRQPYPLFYERAWGGVVSSASYVTGSDGIDFGNTYYNDHHFHYGYFVLAAAIIGYLDRNWLKDNKDYVNILARDYANPSTQDKYFPQHRCFDWYHGHSWAHGLYASLDGKDQESSSEDVMSAYALKMWGQVVGDANMASRADLQLAVLSRSLQNYYLLKSDNKNHPSQFIGNKVAGILFENKCDHTTYFGPNIEFVQGIHMLPLLPATPMVRTKSFVKEEWDAYFSNGRVDEIQSAWKGIIYGNLATLDPKRAWKFFADASFAETWLDGGASLTWYLAYAAAMGGA